MRTVLMTAFTLLCLVSAAPAADYETGINAYSQKDYRTAAANLLPLAADGDTQAQYAVGILYQKGLGVLQDNGLAWFWFTKADQGGHAKAAKAKAELEGAMTPEELEQGKKYLEE